VASADFYAGGVPVWTEYFAAAGTLELLGDMRISDLPDWTLLIRPYEDEYDQGHIAFKLGAGIYHCRADTLDVSARQGLVGPGIIQDGPEGFWPDYYTYVVRVERWAQKEGTPTFTSSSEAPVPLLSVPRAPAAPPP
jgi:hypothetical protein